jgi:hypothetical protein
VHAVNRNAAIAGSDRHIQAIVHYEPRASVNSLCMPVKLGLYVITDRDLCGARGVAETVRRVVRGGARIVQLREKKAGFACRVPAGR